MLAAPDCNGQVNLPTQSTVLAVINHSIQDLGKLLQVKIILKPRTQKQVLSKGFKLCAHWPEVFV